MSIERMIIPLVAFIPAGTIASDTQQQVVKKETVTVNDTNISKEEVQKKVISIISKQLSIPQVNIKPQMSFVNDFHADSLDLVEIIMALEKEFTISIPDEKLEKIETVEDAVSIIFKQLDAENKSNARLHTRSHLYKNICLWRKENILEMKLFFWILILKKCEICKMFK